MEQHRTEEIPFPVVPLTIGEKLDMLKPLFGVTTRDDVIECLIKFYHKQRELDLNAALARGLPVGEGKVQKTNTKGYE